MKNKFNKLFVFILCSISLTEILIPPDNVDDWHVLNDKMPWVGYQNYQGLPWCRSIDIFPYSISEIESFIGDFGNYSNTFHRMISSKIIDTNIVYLRVDYPLFLSDRDYIVKYHSFKEGSSIVYQWSAVQHKNVPVYDDVVRLINAAGEWRLTYLSEESTKVSYSWNGELLGDFPSFYLTTAWETGGKEIIGELKQAIKDLKTIND